MISLFNYISKVLKKVIAEQFSQLSKNFLKLHLGHIKAWKEIYTIDIVTLLIHQVQKNSHKKN